MDEEIRRVIAALYDSSHPAHPAERRLFEARPASHLRRILDHERISWTEQQIDVAAAALVHPSSAMTLDLATAVRGAEDSVAEFALATRPGQRLALVIFNAVFYLGIAVLIAGAVAALDGREVLGALLGGGGIASLVAVFLTWPAEGIKRSVATRVQAEIVTAAYTKQVGLWRSYSSLLPEGANHRLIDAAVIEATALATHRALELIDVLGPSRDEEGAKPTSIQPSESQGNAVPPALPWSMKLAGKALADVQPDMGQQPITPGKQMVEKTVILEKSPLTDQPIQAASHSQPPGPPVKLALEKAAWADTLPGDRPAAEPLQPAEGGAPGPAPFALAMPHRAPGWEDHEPGGPAAALEQVEARLRSCDQMISEMGPHQSDEAASEIMTALIAHRAVLLSDQERIRGKLEARDAGPGESEGP